VPLLVHLFVDRFARQFGKPAMGVSKATMERLLAYPWPGNVRELQNVVERAVVLAQGPVLEFGPELVPAVRVPRPTPTENGGRTLEDVSRDHIVTTLIATNWVIDGPRGAAAMLGVNPSTLRSRIKKLGIRRSADATPSR
jgi:formate hydrogenlyase transcriptional activator